MTELEEIVFKALADRIMENMRKATSMSSSVLSTKETIQIAIEETKKYYKIKG